MLHFLLAIMLLLSISKTCSVHPNWEASSLEDQIHYAGAIIRGRIEEIKGNFNYSSVILKNAVFYRGAGPSKVKINGFTNDTMCGVSPGRINTDIVVFVCRDNQEWTLNNINLFTGSVNATNNIIEILEKETENDIRTENANFIQYKHCRKPIKSYDKLDPKLNIRDPSDSFTSFPLNNRENSIFIGKNHHYLSTSNDRPLSQPSNSEVPFNNIYSDYSSLFHQDEVWNNPRLTIRSISGNSVRTF